MYRILADSKEIRERRNQLRHPRYQRPELVATRPNQVWSWDITKLKGPIKWTYYHLYVMLDLFSRYVVGWLLAMNESASLAARLISEACAKQNIREGQLTIHADRGTAMTSKTLAEKLIDLGVEKTHSRPQVSNDNPFSEAQFRTLKYWPGFPGRFESPLHAREVSRAFFPWYNHEHHHSALCYLTPAGGPPRPGRAGPRRSAPRSHGRLPRTPRALRQRPAQARKAPRGGLDQSARENHAPDCPSINEQRSRRP